MLARVTETRYTQIEPLSIYIVLILTLITASQTGNTMYILSHTRCERQLIGVRVRLNDELLARRTWHFHPNVILIPVRLLPYTAHRTVGRYVGSAFLCIMLILHAAMALRVLDFRARTNAFALPPALRGPGSGLFGRGTQPAFRNKCIEYRERSSGNAEEDVDDCPFQEIEVVV